MSFAAGQRVRAADLNQLGQLVARNSRITASGAVTTTETAFLSTRAPVVAGRSYLVTMQCESIGVTAGSYGQHALRHTTNDVEPTIASAQLTRGIVYHAVANVPQTIVAAGVFDAGATGFLRVLHTLIRPIGTGNISASGSATLPAILTVEDLGDTIASSGTVY